MEERRGSMLTREAQLRDELAASLSAAQRRSSGASPSGPTTWTAFKSDSPSRSRSWASDTASSSQRSNPASRRMRSGSSARAMSSAPRLPGCAKSRAHDRRVGAGRERRAGVPERRAQACAARGRRAPPQARAGAPRADRARGAGSLSTDRGGFAEIEAKQLDQLQRVIDRASSGYSEIASQQFGEAIKVAREDAAKRLAREMDAQSRRSSARRAACSRTSSARSPTRERSGSRSASARSLRGSSDSGTTPSPTRAAAGQARRQLMRRVQALTADVDADRAVLQARLAGLGRRIDETYSRAR